MLGYVQNHHIKPRLTYGEVYIALSLCHNCCMFDTHGSFKMFLESFISKKYKIVQYLMYISFNFSTTLSTVRIAYGAMHSFDHSRSLERMISLPLFATTTAATYMKQSPCATIYFCKWLSRYCKHHWKIILWHPLQLHCHVLNAASRITKALHLQCWFQSREWVKISWSQVRRAWGCSSVVPLFFVKKSLTKTDQCVGSLS